jgi:transposase
MGFELVRHVPAEEMKKVIRKEKDKYVHERLLFIYQLYLGCSVAEACERMCISEQTGYEWLEKWNEQGRDGIGPNFGGGSPPRLTQAQKESIRDKLTSKANWLTTEVRALIFKDLNVAYSVRHVARILRGFGMHYAKPYPHDYRKPDNSVELLRNAIASVVEAIPGNPVLGFFDEASPQTADNKQRFWSFEKPKITKNTTRYRANTFGFYPINGNKVVEFKENSKAHSVREFLRSIKEKNLGRHVVVFLDNFRSHTANATRQFARSLDITLVFLPKYSPDLNPIEFVWKSLRRKVSQIFAKSEWSFRETIRTGFCQLAEKKSFMAGWLEKFGPDLSRLLCP